MISSMTGYGRSDEKNDKLVLSVEIRSVNSRFLDFSPRLPKSLQHFEDEAYKIVKKSCIRGRVTLSAKIEYIIGTGNELTLNQKKLELPLEHLEINLKKAYCEDSQNHLHQPQVQLRGIT